MTRQARILNIFLLTLMAAWRADADTLYLREGEQMPGRLVKMSQDKLWFENSDGTHVFPKAEVHKVQLQQPRLYDDVGTVEQITDPDLKHCLENLPQPAAFPADGSVTLLARRVIDLTREGMVKDTRRFIAIILQQRGEDIATSNAWYFEDTDSPRVDFALTITPDGRVLHLDDAALKNESTFATLPDYRRLARYRFACKEPRPGCVIDIQYTLEQRRDPVLEPWFVHEVFRGGEPILRKEVVVLVPDAKAEAIASQLTGPAVVNMSRESANGVTRFTWSLTDPQPGIRTEPMMPPTETFAATLTVAPADTWESIAARYSEALSELPPLPRELVDKAKALAADGGARAIHYYLARGIATVGVPQLAHRMVPHAPADTAKRGLANELDKNILYWKMLEAAGVDCAFALVRGRGEGPLHEQTPSPRAFDHSAVYLASEATFSSVAADTLPFGALPGGLQGAPALLIGAKENCLAKTQQASPGQELGTTAFNAALTPDGTLMITVGYGGTGNSGAWIRQFKDLDDQKLRNRLQQLAGYLHAEAVLKDFSLSDLSDLTVEPRLEMTCEIPNYAITAGEDLMMFTLPALFYTAQEVGRPDREFDMFWGHPSGDETTGRIEIPGGFTVYSVPHTVDFDSPVASFRAKISTEGNAIAYSDSFALKVQDASREAYADYKKCMELRARIPLQRVVLTRKGK